MSSQFATLPLSSLHLDPSNVRRDTDKREDLTASIRAVGVLQPLIVRPNPEGGYIITAGERRYRSCLDAEVETVPCVIAEDPDLAVALARLHENTGRDDLTPAETAHGIRQVLDLGGDMKSLVAGLNMPAKTLRALVKVQKLDDDIVAGVHAGTLTLEQATAVGDIHESDPELGDSIITVAANRGNVEWALRQAKETLHLRSRQDVGRTHAESLGVPYFDRLEAGHARLRADQTGEHPIGSCLGVLVDKQWGASETFDYVCTNPASHRDGADGAPDEGEQKEAERAARRRVIANNKAFDMANEVRAEWLATFTQRTTAPKGALTHIARLNMYLAPEARHYREARTTAGMGSDHWPAPETIQEQVSNDATALRVMMLAVIKAAEMCIGREVWRSNTRWLILYYAALAQWGYTLTPPEKHLVATLEAKQDPRETDYPTE